MAINRLFEIVYLLLNKKTMTAGELAAHFEVSKRTILRDIEVLSQAGIPIYTTPGKGGGISILDHFVFHKAMLSDEEQNQLLFALQGLAMAEHANIQPMLLKLQALFDKTESNWIEVDFSRWGQTGSDQAKFEIMRKAIINKLAISFLYLNIHGEMDERTVYPLKLVFKSKEWYLQAYCLLRKDYRIYKINRMFSLEGLPDSFADKQFTLPAMEQRASTSDNLIHLALRFSSNVLSRLYDEFNMEQVVPDCDGFFIVNVDLPEDQWLYGFLLSFGRSVEVLAPKSVKETLQKEIEKIYFSYLVQ